MATHLKLPIEVRHEFLQRLYCAGLSNESIDVVIEQMWYRFEVGEYTEKRHSEIRVALETSNPLSQRCHKRMREYWEDLPRLPNGIIVPPTDKVRSQWENFDARIDHIIRMIHRRLQNVEDTTFANPIINEYVIKLIDCALRFEKLALKGAVAYLDRMDAREQAEKESDSDPLNRLILLVGDDNSPPNIDDSTSDANEGETGERPAIRV